MTTCPAELSASDFCSFEAIIYNGISSFKWGKMAKIRKIESFH